MQRESYNIQDKPELPQKRQTAAQNPKIKPDKTVSF